MCFKTNITAVIICQPIYSSCSKNYHETFISIYQNRHVLPLCFHTVISWWDVGVGYLASVLFRVKKSLKIKKNPFIYWISSFIPSNGMLSLATNVWYVCHIKGGYYKFRPFCNFYMMMDIFITQVVLASCHNTLFVLLLIHPLTHFALSFIEVVSNVYFFQNIVMTLRKTMGLYWR